MKHSAHSHISSRLGFTTTMLFLSLICLMLFHVSPTQAATAQSLKDVGLIDVTASPYNADPTCQRDSTQAIQKAMDYAYNNNYVTFFPSGEYCISDTLIGNYYTVTPNKLGYELVGSTKAAKPTIRLKANSPGFNNPNSPKVVIDIKALCGKKTGCRKDIIPYGAENAANGFYQSIRNLAIDVETGNAGAIGVGFQGAQRNSIVHVQVNLKSGLAGFNGMPGDNSTLSDIEVNGGKYGIIADKLDAVVKWPTMTDVRLYNQTDASIYHYGGTNWTFSGLHIKKASAPAIVPSSSNAGVENTVLYDSKIEFDQLSQTPAIDNANNKSFLLVNTYFKNAPVIMKSPSETITGSNNWKRITTYGYAGDRGLNVIDGVTKNTSLKLAISDQSPPSNLISPHALDLRDYPTPDVILDEIRSGNPNYANVADFDIIPVDAAITCNNISKCPSTPDVTTKLQNLINSGKKIIFFPRGQYAISDTIELKDNTHLLGVANQLSGLTMSSSWRPTTANPATMIRTPNSASASPKISYFRTSFRTDPPYDNYRGIINIRSGKTTFVDTEFRPMINNTTSDTRPNVRILMNGNAGGRIYGLNLGANEPRNQHAGYRHLLIDGTVNPLVIYGPNPEDHDFHGRLGGWGMEIKNSKNVSIVGAKQENHNTLLVDNSSNIALLGLSNFDNVQIKNSNNYLGSMYAFYSGSDNSDLFTEEFSGKTITVDKSNMIGAFSRGSVDWSKLAYSQSSSGGDQIEWDLDSDGDVDVIDFNLFVKKVMDGKVSWTKLSSLKRAYSNH